MLGLGRNPSFQREQPDERSDEGDDHHRHDLHPLTFIVRVYGMNFDPAAGPLSMPELGWRYSYPAILVLMAMIAAGLLIWFRLKGWIGRGRD